MPRTHIVLHHTATSFDTTVEQIRNYHVKVRGWRDIGYNYLVDQRGKVHPGRSLDIAGAHTKEANMNTWGIGVACIADFDKNHMPDAQRKRLIELLFNLCKEHGIPTENIKRHKDFSPTACPGKYFPYEEIIKEVSELLRPGEKAKPATEAKQVKVFAGGKTYYGELKDGKTLVHVRVLEEFGYTVHWDGKKVHVYEREPPPLYPKHEHFDTYDVITCQPSQVIPATVKGILTVDGINGGYLDGGLNPLGIVMIDGKVISERVGRVPPRTCLIITKDGEARIVKVDKASEVLSAKHILGAGPSLLPEVAKDEGFQPDVMISRRERTAVGINHDGNLLLVTTVPMKLGDLSDLMAGLGCKSAVNMDGGGSVVMRFNGKLIRGGERAISTALIIKEG